MRVKRLVNKALGIHDDIEGILFSLTTRYHLLRVMTRSGHYFLYLVLDRRKANLALARRALREIDDAWVAAASDA